MKIIKVLILLLLTISEISIAQKSIQTKSIVNMDKNIGIIRLLHGGNNGPVSALKVLGFTEVFKECKIPVIRLHDVSWSNN